MNSSTDILFFHSYSGCITSDGLCVAMPSVLISSRTVSFPDLPDAGQSFSSSFFFLKRIELETPWKARNWRRNNRSPPLLLPRWLSPFSLRVRSVRAAPEPIYPPPCARHSGFFIVCRCKRGSLHRAQACNPPISLLILCKRRGRVRNLTRLTCIFLFEPLFE